MRVFVDTSALLALLVQNDAAHDRARDGFAHLRSREATVLTSSYVLVETYALLGRRFGIEAVRRFRATFAPLLDTIWVDAETHEKGLDLLHVRGTRDLSLVDAVSFVIIRERKVDRTFAFDRHFTAEGFNAFT